MKNSNRRKAEEGPVDCETKESEDLVLNALDNLYDALDEENKSEELETWIESMKTPGTYGSHETVSLGRQIRIERQKHGHIQVFLGPGVEVRFKLHAD